MAIAATRPLPETSFQKPGLLPLTKWELAKATRPPSVEPPGVRIIVCTPPAPESGSIRPEQFGPWSNFYLGLAEEDKKLQEVVRSEHSPSLPSEDSEAIEALHGQGTLPPALDEQEILDWDAHIETPPPRPSRTIRVKLVYAGRSRPLPAENPYD